MCKNKTSVTLSNSWEKMHYFRKLLIAKNWKNYTVSEMFLETWIKLYTCIFV